MVTLVQVKAGNPFAEHPALREIFGASAHVEADTVSDLLAGEADPAGNHVYLVLAGDEVVGITGFYQPSVADPETIGLRWHGIIPAHRCHGYSGAAFRAVCKAAKAARPGARFIVEYVPLADPVKGDLLTRYFRSLRFERIGLDADATAFPSSVSLPPDSGRWRAMRYVLADSATRPVYCGKGIIDDLPA